MALSPIFAIYLYDDNMVHMSNIASIAKELGAMSAGYEPSDATKAVLEQKELVPLIGPFAVGKTALMRAAERLDADFGRVRSFTTRARRSGEDEGTYEFLPHDAAILRRIHAQAKARDLVQFIVHPATGNIYGSSLDSYRTAYSMLDTMPTSLPGLVSLPFRAIKKVAIAVPPKVWEGRVAERLRDGDADDIRKRMGEGITNLSWCLDQADDELGWVVNGDQNIHSAARDLIHVVRDGNGPNAVARNMAFSLLESMRELQEH